MVKKNGDVIDVLLSATTEKDAQGNVIRSLAVINDVTERKRVEEEIRRHRDSLAAANEELKAFSYSPTIFRLPCDT